LTSLIEMRDAISIEWDPKIEEIEDFLVRRFPNVATSSLIAACAFVLHGGIRREARRRLSDPRA